MKIGATNWLTGGGHGAGEVRTAQLLLVRFERPLAPCIAAKAATFGE